ncbi:MAG: hypothetical protein E7048_09200 [Lentisphaerae bacterium]|nr:hypothetical protein [Lentisphaerota bacterium]
MYTLEEITALRQKCDELQLEGREILDHYSDEELQVICNGIGPEVFPSWARHMVSGLHPTLETAAFIHDAEWGGRQDECSKEHFTASNERFRENGCIAARAEYGWYNLLRYLVMDQARRFSNYCQLFGYGFYKESKQCAE